MEDISDILEEHAERHFHPYVAYCSNEVYQQRALQRLTSSNAAFRDVLREIEKRPACGGLPMISFLILPMQRVTRLPLLMDVSGEGAARAGRGPGFGPRFACAAW